MSCYKPEHISRDSQSPISLKERFTPRHLFSDGHIKWPNVNFLTNEYKAEAANAERAKEIEGNSSRVRKILAQREFSIQLAKFYNLDQDELTRVKITKINLLTSNRGIAMLVILHLNEEPLPPVILLSKNLQAEKVVSNILQLVEMPYYRIEPHRTCDNVHTGLVEVVPGVQLDHAQKKLLEPYDEDLAFELGRHAAVFHVLMREDRGQTNYIVNPTAAQGGVNADNLLTGIDHEDVFMIGADKTKRIDTYFELFMVENLHSYSGAKAADLLNSFCSGCEEQFAVLKRESATIGQIVDDNIENLKRAGRAQTSRLAEIVTSRIDQGPGSYLDAAFTFREVIHANLFAKLRRRMLNRW